MPGHHHHRHGQQAAIHPLFKQGDAIAIGHPDVQQHQIWPFLQPGRARGSGILCQLHAIAFVLQDIAQQFAYAYFVIDH